MLLQPARLEAGEHGVGHGAPVVCLPQAHVGLGLAVKIGAARGHQAVQGGELEAARHRLLAVLGVEALESAYAAAARFSHQRGQTGLVGADDARVGDRRQAVGAAHQAHGL